MGGGPGAGEGHCFLRMPLLWAAALLLALPPTDDVSLRAPLNLPLNLLHVQGDFFSLHMPLTPNTKGMFNDEAFGRVRAARCQWTVLLPGCLLLPLAWFPAGRHRPRGRWGMHMQCNSTRRTCSCAAYISLHPRTAHPPAQR